MKIAHKQLLLLLKINNEVWDQSNLGDVTEV